MIQVKNLPLIVSEALRIDWKLNQLVFDLPARVNEIMKFNALYPKLPGWQSKISLLEGIRNI